MSADSATGIIVLLLVSTASAAQAEKPNLKAVASVTEIMKAMMVPTSAAIWNVGRNPPTDDEAWEALKNYSVLLGESGNLLLIGDRARDDKVWRSTSLTMVEAGVLALKAAKAKNVDGINDAGNLMVDACELCHERHWER